MPHWTHDRYEREVAFRVEESAPSAFERVLGRILAYDIFPTSLLWSVTCPAGEVAEGTVIIQRLHRGRVSLEFAVLVTDRWDHESVDGRRAGFRYVTLEGHPERGVETFEVGVDNAGRVTVVIEARSQPGTWLTQVGRPIARRVQTFATQQALLSLAGEQLPA